MSRTARRVSRSGIAKIVRALACGFRPGNGWSGPGQFLRLRRVERRQRKGVQYER